MPNNSHVLCNTTPSPTALCPACPARPLSLAAYLTAANTVYAGHGFDTILTPLISRGVTVDLLRELHHNEKPMLLVEILKGAIKPGHCLLMVVGYPKIIAVARGGRDTNGTASDTESSGQATDTYDGESVCTDGSGVPVGVRRVQDEYDV